MMAVWEGAGIRKLWIGCRVDVCQAPLGRAASGGFLPKDGDGAVLCRFGEGGVLEPMDEE